MMNFSFLCRSVVDKNFQTEIIPLLYKILMHLKFLNLLLREILKFDLKKYNISYLLLSNNFAINNYIIYPDIINERILSKFAIF